MVTLSTDPSTTIATTPRITRATSDMAVPITTAARTPATSSVGSIPARSNLRVTAAPASAAAVDPAPAPPTSPTSPAPRVRLSKSMIEAAQEMDSGAAPEVAKGSRVAGKLHRRSKEGEAKFDDAKDEKGRSLRLRPTSAGGWSTPVAHEAPVELENPLPYEGDPKAYNSRPYTISGSTATRMGARPRTASGNSASTTDLRTAGLAAMFPEDAARAAALGMLDGPVGTVVRPPPTRGYLEGWPSLAGRGSDYSTGRSRGATEDWRRRPQSSASTASASAGRLRVRQRGVTDFYLSDLDTG
mmetsp:Transcript_143009/g.319814  ORF Transcript_143009/g.319814 Transcript_143009/m.319814 type:complete len:300 (+) Transcript_143009:544-1443(+)